MKTKLIITLLMLAAISLNAQKSAIIKFDVTSHDFGKIKEEAGKAITTYGFTNVGTDTLKITEAKPSCSCISTDWTKTPIPPNGKGVIIADYDPYRHSGPFDKSIWVYSNATDKTFTLGIKGDVIPKVKTLLDSFPVENGNLRFGAKYFVLRDTKSTEIRKDSMDVYNSGNKSISMRYGQLPEHITGYIKPEILSAKKKGKLYITYDATKKKDFGLLYDYLTLNTNDTISPNKQLTVSATIVDDFSKLTTEQKLNAAKIVFTNDYVDYGSVKEGDTVRVDFEFKNTGKENLIIRKAEPGNGAIVSVDKKIIAPDESSKIHMKFGTLGQTGEQKRTILLTTNDPSRSFMIIVGKGQVTPK